MTDTPKKPLTLSKPLDLKKVEVGQVKQSFSHGRSKTVTVEVKKKRLVSKPHEEAAPQKPAQEFSKPPQKKQAEEVSSKKLTSHEADARRKAVEGALKAALEEQERREEELQREEERRKEEELKKAQEALEAPAQVEAEEPVSTEEQPISSQEKPAAVQKKRSTEEDEDDVNARKSPARHHDHAKKVIHAPKKEEARRPNNHRVNLSSGDEEDGGGRRRSLASIKRAQKKVKLKSAQFQQEAQKIVRDVTIPETITVQELANRLAERSADVVKCLMKMGVMATVNQVIDGDTAELVVSEMGHKSKRVSEADVELGLKYEEDTVLVSRAPVVTVMGHVDHGKTSLLDALRKTDVVAGEAGGITQHIGAYQVTLSSGQKITFIDTPGHAAFTEMRARGANVTDIVVLVVAADDGVKDQTIEAIRHAKAANVPMIVAVNKIDKPDARPEKVREMLLSHEIVVEQLGGDVQSIEVSAKQQLNLDKLEEAILLQAEILDLKAGIKQPAEGVVVEAKLEKGRGPVATLLVQKGTLKVGDILIAGSQWGKVRALVNDHGQKIDEATPSMPVEVLGLNDIPVAGDEFVIVPDEAKAREVTEFRQRRHRDLKALQGTKTLDQLFSQTGGTKELAVVIKSDVHGSLEAISTSLQKLSTDEVTVKILHAAVGGITESDITLARASSATIIGFNVRANPQARDLAKQNDIEIRYYSIIYDVIDDIKAALGGLLSPTLREKFLGYAQIREVFDVSKVGKIAGCYITEGTVKRGASVRLLRDNVVIHEGSLKTLRRFKDEVREVKEGYECGMSFENYQDIRANDVIECFEVESIQRSLA